MSTGMFRCLQFVSARFSFNLSNDLSIRVAGCPGTLASRRFRDRRRRLGLYDPQSFRPPSSNRTMVYDKKTKIFCTMGPACWDVPTITTLIDAGMNTARLNFSHGDHAAHGATMDRVKEAAALRPGAPR